MQGKLIGDAVEQIVSESSVPQIVSEDDNSSVDHHVAECSGDSVDKIVAEWMLMLTEIVFSPGAQRRSKLLQQLRYSSVASKL